MNESGSSHGLPLDSRQLRAFLMLARKGSFTQAAKELHLSQSAVSHSMKALERDVGCRLFDRVGKSALLTQAGEQLLARVDRIMTEMLAARSELRVLSQWGHGRLRIGASEAVCQFILPPVLCEFRKKFPDCQLQIETGETDGLVQSLQRNELDLAVTLAPKHPVDLDFSPLFTDEMMFLVNPQHPWAQARRVLRAEISKQSFVLYTRRGRAHELIAAHFQAEDMNLRPGIEMGSLAALCEATKLGLGITILAPWIARPDLDKRLLVAVPLGRRKLRGVWGTLHRQGHPPGWAQETFLQLLRTATTQFAAKNGLLSHV